MKYMTSSINIIALYGICFLNILYMHIFIIKTCNTEFGLSWVSWIDNLSGIVFDITIISLLSYLFSYKFKRIGIILTFLLTLGWSFCNITYSRFFHSYLSLSAIEQFSSLFDPVVVESTFHGIHYQDMFFIISPILFFFIYGKTNEIDSIKYITKQIHATFVLFLLSLSAHAIDCFVNPDYRYLAYYSNRIFSRHIGKHLAICSPISTTFARGSIRMLGLEFYEQIKGAEKLTKEQISRIEYTIKESEESMVGLQADDKMQKNIIFIIVESYLSFTSDLIIDGKEITPNLNTLKHDSTVYYNGHVQSNITLGESSDGQYTYMTGLLPLRSVITISKARNRTLPGLPKVFAQKGVKSIMIIPTQPTLWDQTEMCQQYGFNMLYSSSDLIGDHDLSLNDQQVFELASNENIFPSQHENYFSVILTMSMHQPYTSPVDPSFSLQDPSLSDDLKNYLNACHYTDKYIGKFINQLKSTGHYDNSIIIIASDHHIHSTDFGSDIPKELPLYIINGHIDHAKAWFGECNQIDIYTTLLDLLGYRNKYCGLGHSLLNSTYENSLSKEKWTISEWILLGDYFKTMQQE